MTDFPVFRRAPNLFYCIMMATFLLSAGCQSGPEERPLTDTIHAFYYGWYGNVETDGELRHWNHEVLGIEDPVSFPGGGDIGADYYPELGNYSSNDQEVIRKHLEQCVQAGIGVLVVSWWGAGSFEDQNLALLLDAATEFGVEVAFHLEPFPDRGAVTTREALDYLINRFGAHAALHRSPRHDGRPVVYIYDSYLTPATEWARLFTPAGDLSIRNTPHDVVAIGLWVQEDEGSYFLEGGFDGFYTYFAADGFTYGSSTENWPALAAWSEQHGLTFIPCVGPGYIDTRIRPWNGATTRSREQGEYYDRMFQEALETQSSLVGITSFNEWHEGTQIEPAVPKSIEGFTYEDYVPREPEFYLERTRYWADKHAKSIIN